LGNDPGRDHLGAEERHGVGLVGDVHGVGAGRAGFTTQEPLGLDGVEKDAPFELTGADGLTGWRIASQNRHLTGWRVGHGPAEEGHAALIVKTRSSAGVMRVLVRSPRTSLKSLACVAWKTGGTRTRQRKESLSR
jgi:hypothetical protein